MTGPEPKSADLIATEPTTVLPWGKSAPSSPTPACIGWLPHTP